MTPKESNAKFGQFCPFLDSSLGTPFTTKADGFSEKFQTAFNRLWSLEFEHSRSVQTVHCSWTKGRHISSEWLVLEVYWLGQAGTSCGKLASGWQGPKEFMRTKRSAKVSSVLGPQYSVLSPES